MRRTFYDPENEPDDLRCTREGQTVFNTEAATQTPDWSFDLLLHGNDSRNNFTSSGLYRETAGFLTSPIIERLSAGTGIFPSTIAELVAKPAGSITSQSATLSAAITGPVSGYTSIAPAAELLTGFAVTAAGSIATSGDRLGSVPGIASLSAALGSTSTGMLTKRDGSIGITGTGGLDWHNAELGIMSTGMPANCIGRTDATIKGILTSHDWNLGVTSTGVRAEHDKIGGVDFGVKAAYSWESFGSQTLARTFGRIQNGCGVLDPTLSVGVSGDLLTASRSLCDSTFAATAGLSLKSPLNEMAGTSLRVESVFGALSSNQVDVMLPIANGTRDMFASSHEQYLLSSRTNVLTTARPLSLGPAVDYCSTTILSILSRPITDANEGIYRHAETQIKQQQFSVKLPLQFNNGKDVPAEWLEDAKLELTDLFGGVSYVEGGGLWKHEGVVFPNTWIWIMVEAPDLDSNQRLMKQFQRAMGTPSRSD